MEEFSAYLFTPNDPYWSQRLEVNAAQAILHQWKELEKSGCIDNFRIVAGDKQGFREGWVFADSDAYKWLDAASRIYASHPDSRLKELMDGLIDLLSRAQMPDGYLYTYNQFHFPGMRWVNLQIEHEMYCLGHLIEAGISHREATGETGAFEIALKAADLLVEEFHNARPEFTDGHEEIELALLKLHQATGKPEYLALARHFIEVRGRIPFYFLHYRREQASHQARREYVAQARAAYAAGHPEYAESKIPPDNESKLPPFSIQRRRINALLGLYTQQHAPVRQQTVPVGHSVRYGYLQTATAMLSRLAGDPSLVPALEESWERLITRRMYVTGGLGSLPGNEGFGRDDELDPEYAYNETCAALASMFWNWEMTLLTGKAQHADLFEWQLYNAAAPGMGSNGECYLYNNPLASRGGITRRAWYSVPCCPPNLSRTWASLGKYVFSRDERNLWVHQYFGLQADPARNPGINIFSALPYNGRVTLRFGPGAEGDYTLRLRLPSWCASSGVTVRLNGEPYPVPASISPRAPSNPADQGYDPRLSAYLPIERSWSAGDEIQLDFDMPIIMRRALGRVKDHAGKAALTRGPLVYCLESTDNRAVDLFTVVLDPSSLFTSEENTSLGRITLLRGRAVTGEPLIFIPYNLWANRGMSQMNVWVRVTQKS